MDNVDSGPHKFRPLKKFFNRGRCYHCHLHEKWHPVNGWSPARAMGDKSLPHFPPRKAVV